MSALVIAVAVKAFVAQAFYIPSESMVPQLQVNDRIVVSRLAYHLHDPRRGDIVVFASPGPKTTVDSDPVLKKAARGLLQAVGVMAPSTEDFVKRVIALPGETVDGHNGQVFINGKLLVEPYLPHGTVTSDFGPVKVPAGRVWVMGDNRPNSADSRVFGPIRESSIVGRAIVKVWPFSQASFL